VRKSGSLLGQCDDILNAGVGSPVALTGAVKSCPWTEVSPKSPRVFSANGKKLLIDGDQCRATRFTADAAAYALMQKRWRTFL
jgi:hypothetical protein